MDKETSNFILVLILMVLFFVSVNMLIITEFEKAIVRASHNCTETIND